MSHRENDKSRSQQSQESDSIPNPLFKLKTSKKCSHYNRAEKLISLLSHKERKKKKQLVHGEGGREHAVQS